MRALLDAIATELSTAQALDLDVRHDARREARLLVGAVLDLSPGEVARQLDRPLSATERERIVAATARRVRGEPLAYCAGRAAFRDLVLEVDARVLIPRPETEIVVAEALRVTADRAGGTAVDIGTGSGAIALSLATEGRFSRVIATDISTDALSVAGINAEAVAARHGASMCPIEFRVGADLGPLAGVVARVIVSNPPYISFAEASTLPASVRDWEPPTALFAAGDGMARYEAIFATARGHLEPDGWLVLEVDATRAQRTADLAAARGFTNVRLVTDLSGRSRVLVAKNACQAPVARRP
jgi:release factor glutamine methyltransferase